MSQPVRNLKALCQLRRVVQDAPTERFDMSQFTNEFTPFGRPTCGTAHCAAGWACLDPWFIQNTNIRDGFLVEPSRYNPGFFTVQAVYMDLREHLADVFGLKANEAENLFALVCGRPHRTKDQVLSKIDDLIAGK